MSYPTQFLTIALLVLLFNPITSVAMKLDPEVEELFTKAAKTGEYKIDVVQKKRGKRKSETIVILGETHKKTQEAGLIGKEIVSHFSLFGIEGPDESELQPNYDNSLLASWPIYFSNEPYQLSKIQKNWDLKTYPSTLNDILNPHEHSIEGSYMIEALLHFDYLMTRSKQIRINGEQVIYKYLVGIYDIDPKFRQWCASVGISSGLIKNKDRLDHILLKARLALFDDQREIVPLEAYSPCPRELKIRNESLGKIYTLTKACCVLVTSALLANLLGDYIPEEIRTSLNTAVAVGLSGTVEYARSTLNPILPQRCQIPVDPFDFNENQNWAQEERDLNMAITAVQALKGSKKNNTILMVVGMDHNPGILKILTEYLGYRLLASY